MEELAALFGETVVTELDDSDVQKEVEFSREQHEKHAVHHTESVE